VNDAISLLICLNDKSETMRSLFWTLSLVLHTSIVQATQVTDVGLVDWYKQLVGVPLVESSSTAPTFQRVQGKEIILTATASNVLAALNPEDGSVGESISHSGDVYSSCISVAIYL